MRTTLTRFPVEVQINRGLINDRRYHAINCNGNGLDHLVDSGVDHGGGNFMGGGGYGVEAVGDGNMVPNCTFYPILFQCSCVLDLFAL